VGARCSVRCSARGCVARETARGWVLHEVEVSRSRVHEMAAVMAAAAATTMAAETTASAAALEVATAAAAAYKIMMCMLYPD